MRWFELLNHRQTWAFAIGKFMTDPIWWFYLYWLPKFLDARYGIKLAQLALPLIVIYLVADVGSVFGGWLSGCVHQPRLDGECRAQDGDARRGAVHRADDVRAGGDQHVGRGGDRQRRGGRAPMVVGEHLHAQQRHVPALGVGSVVGIGGFFGAAGGVLFQRATGWVLQHNGSNYTPIFIVCGSAYVTALLIIHLLSPRLERA